MPTVSESVQDEQHTEVPASRRLYRSNSQKVIAGVCGGLGEYFAVDPVWFRVGFVVLAFAGGSGILIYLLMWAITPPQPDGHISDRSVTQTASRGSVSGAVVIGVVFMLVGTVALVDSLAPWFAQYIWPTIFVVGGLSLVLGGLTRDTHR